MLSRLRSGIIKCPQRIHSPSFSHSGPWSVISCRHTSQLSSEADPANPPASDLTSPGSASGNHESSLPEIKISENLTAGTPAYKISARGSGVGVLRTEHLGRYQQTLPNIWLRDNCRCSQCVNQDTMQRNFSIFDIPATVAPLEIKQETGGLRIIWNHEQHESVYTWDFLERHLHQGVRPSFDPSKRELWGSEIANDPPTVGYDEVMNDASESGMAKLTDLLMRYGLVFVDRTPFDDASHTKRLLERIGPVRETHYGGFYDFVPDMAKADTAYTNIALPAHTDTTYFTDPAGLQAFHMLSHTAPPDAPEGTSVSGGESLLVDGFRAADILRNEALDSFKTLSGTPVPWHASGNQGVTITPDEPQPVIQVLKMGSTDPATKSLLRIRWNNDDRGVPPMGVRGHQKVVAWYKSAAKWNEILKRSSSEFWFQLKPGRTLIFDNYRVLHGRSAFTGMRRICGAYINRDDFVSRWRNTNFPRNEVLAQAIG